MAATSISPDVQKRLYAETDARFAVTTGVTRKLDPHNPVDQPLVPIWGKIYQTVLGEYRSPAGVQWSIDHPIVVTAIGNANAATSAATGSLAQSVAAPDATAAKTHSNAAGAALTQGATALQQAAPHVPVSVPTSWVTSATEDFHQKLGPLIAQGQVTPADAVTAMQVAAAPAHAAQVAQAAPASPALVQTAPAAAAATAEEVHKPNPIPWKPLLAVTGLFGVGVALANRGSSSSGAGRTYRMRRAR